MDAWQLSYERHSLSGFQVHFWCLQRGKLVFQRLWCRNIFLNQEWIRGDWTLRVTFATWLDLMHADVGLCNIFSVVTYRGLAILVMSFLSMVSLRSLVSNTVPMGITVSMVGGGTMLPMANRICCLLLTVLAISLVIWVTIVWIMSQWGQQP